MTALVPGRVTVDRPDESIAVFLIGMRINRLSKVRSWAPVITAMPKMLRHLEKDPDAGLLGVHSWLGRTTVLLSYWRTPEDIARFASDPAAPHAEAWREFNRTISASEDVGVWHETYTARPDDSEAIYVNMPAFGLAAATGHRPVGPGSQTWWQRMGIARPRPTGSTERR